MSKSGTTATFLYNADGLRIRKTVGSTVTNYNTLHGKNIVHLAQGSNNLHFFYDAQNRPAVVNFNGTKYGYIVYLQGDVLGLIDSTGAEVVKYTYDAWGKVLSTTGSLASTLGTIQPFRYRGYVYDVETGLYYLRSRYYQPSFGRFLNADTLVEKNLFIYCSNSPVIKVDTSGLADYLIIYDSRPDKSEGSSEGAGFPKQKDWWVNQLEEEGYIVDARGFTSIAELAEVWNSIDEEYDYLIMICHGAPGSIDCHGEYMSKNPPQYDASQKYKGYDYDQILSNSIKIRYISFLFSCHGGTTGSQGISAAQMISAKTYGAPVCAMVNASVKYKPDTGYPIAAVGEKTLKNYINYLFRCHWQMQRYVE